MKRYFVLLLINGFILTYGLSLHAQQRMRHGGGKPFTEQRADSTAKGAPGMRRHITDMAPMAKGMFNIYKTGKGDYYLEIPDSLLKRDMLFGSRVNSISNNSRISAGQRRTNPIMVYFARQGNMLLMYQPSVLSYADSTDIVSESLQRNNATPVAMSFDIIERNAHNDASLIDVTRLFTSEVPLVWPAGVTNGEGHADPKLTAIVMAKSFNKNVEFKTSYNFTGGREPFCITVQYSFVLLPRTPYRPRFADDRIGIMNENKRKYGSDKPIVSQRFIDRWKIVPRKEDMEKYKRGQLVEPEQPIVFYVDTLMPQQWRKYVHAGIEAWNAAFEKIGFKHVIKAVDYPRSASFDADDSRFNCFKYITSTEANAQGSHWVDPRSGEIIQGEILWWHSVLDKLRSWIFVQTAAADKEVRGKEVPEATLGTAIRYATAHEMGHVLGFEHNMRGSYAYPTDSLRSPSFTQRYGTTASIMDYARNNYVAQPGDKEKGVWLYPPLLGPYDYLAIEYSYKLIPEATTSDEEVPVLNDWLAKVQNNPMYLFSPTTISPVLPDPSSQSDALGNDLVKSARYGVANLRYILSNLIRWTLKPNDPLDLLKARYSDIVKLFEKITNLPISYLGGVYVYAGTYGQHKNNNIPVTKEKQQETLNYLIKEVADAPQWLAPKEITSLVGSQTNEITSWQSGIIDDMLGSIILSRIAGNEITTGYSVSDYLKDVDNAFWRHTVKASLSDFDKNLQMKYVENIIKLATTATSPNSKNAEKSFADNVSASAAYNELVPISHRLTTLAATAKTDKSHYLFLLRMIRKAL
jgi:hypothetical protein